MKKQIVQILHNLLGKGIKSDGKTDVNKSVSQELTATESDKSDGTLQDESAVQLVERKSFEKIVNDSLNAGQGKGCLLVCDVDRCRDINDIYGRDTGDAVLRYVACVLCDIFGGYARIGSQSNDVFALWLPEMSGDNADAIRKLTGMVNDRLLHPMGGIPPSSLSVGVSFYESGDDCKSLMKRANKALYLVKESGRCGCEMSL